MTIKEMRLALGKTQREFATLFEIPIGTLRRWEYGESSPAPYVVKMIADRLPMFREGLERVDYGGRIFYYDNESKFIFDETGTRISFSEDLRDVKEQNLALYAADLFDAYYEIIEKFNNDCALDKTEDVLWG